MVRINLERFCDYSIMKKSSWKGANRELMDKLMNLLLNFDKTLGQLIHSYGEWTYLILFLIVFSETGLVVTPFLPGDSLLFAVGAFSAQGSLKILWAWGVLCIAAILGDTVNYKIGQFVGPKVFAKGDNQLINRRHLERARLFFNQHGGKTIVLARFIPIIRTYVPFIAGVSNMNYFQFLVYNISGGILWVSTFLLGGYFFGNLPIVKENFSLFILAILVLSVLPVVIEYIKTKRDLAQKES